MFLDDIKQNINKIDSDLKQVFENVYIIEKADKNGHFVEISANKVFLFEGCKKRVEVKTSIRKDDLRFDVIKWNYSLNPLDESADKIERVSHVNTLGKDIYDIASNKRMINEYFESLEAFVDLICEDANVKLNLHTPIVNQVADIVFKYAKVSDYTYESPIEFTLTEKISMANKFNVEKELLTNENVNFVSFGNNTIKVTIK